MADDKQKTIGVIGCEGCESNSNTPASSAPVCEDNETGVSTCEKDCGTTAPICGGNCENNCDSSMLDCRLIAPINNGDGEDTLFSTLAQVSAKTLYYLFLTLAVLAVFISQLFPYHSMRFYYDMGGYETAVVYAQKYTKAGGNKRTEALLYGIEMSEVLLYESESAKNAEYLLYFTNEFLCLPAAEIEERCAALDGYYQNAYKEGRISLLAAVGLYSFKDYVYGKNVAARSVLGETDFLPYDNDFGLSGQAFITPQQLKDLLVATVDGDYTPSLRELAIIFNQLSENMAHGGSLILDGDFGITTTLYRFAAEVIAPEGDGYNYITQCQNVEGIEKLYLISAANSFAGSAIVLFEDKGLSDDAKDARDLFVIESGGETISLSDYYGELLRQYK